MHVLQRHRAGFPTSGSCCYSASSSSVSEMGKAYSKKFPTSSSLLEMKAQETKGKESLLPFQVTLFFPSLGSGLSSPHYETSPSRGETHLPPPVAPRPVPRELGPQQVHPFRIKGWTQQFNHLNLAVGGHREEKRNGWGREEPNDHPWPSCPPSHSTFHATNTQPWGKSCEGEKSTVIIYWLAEAVIWAVLWKVLGFLMYGRQKAPKLGCLGWHLQWREGAWCLASLPLMGPKRLTVLNPF